MYGVTAELYIGATPFPGWDNLTYVKKVNISAMESSYTASQVRSAISSLYMWNRGDLVASTASILDQYAPDWQQNAFLCLSAPDYTGSVEKSPDNYTKLFPYADNIAYTFIENTGAGYLRFPNDDTNYIWFPLGETTYPQRVINLRLNDYQYDGLAWGLSVYPYGATKGAPWDGVDRWYMSGCWFIKCADELLYISQSVYSTNGTIRITAFSYSSTHERDLLRYIDTHMREGWKPVPKETDPYAPGGNSGTGGGNGTFADTGDSIDFPGLPTLSASEAGFITLFNPSNAQLRALARYMWTDSLFDVNNFKKIFADPMQAILGLSIVPVAIPEGRAENVKVGNIDTGVSMPVVNTQYIEVDCGTLDLQEYWGAYLDYSPYTKAELYLPYIGTHPIDIDDIMGKSIHVKYHVDILSGACCAYVMCNDVVLYSFIGQCASSIPITGDNFTNVINGAISIAGAVGSMVASGGASAPMVAGIASTAVNSFKPTVEKSGAMAGTGGMLGIQTPYLIITRPRQALPANQNKYIGYPSFITMSLADLEGYTEIESIHLENIPATDSELNEIENLLKGGVIF